MILQTLKVTALIAMLSFSGSAAARTCSVDDVPAATLLFPFVVLDYNNPDSGDITLLDLTNTSADAQIVRVTIWSDAHIPVLAFNLVLSGYDSQGLNIRDILINGILPVTGTSGGEAESGSVSEHGPVDGSPDLGPPDSTFTIAQRCPSTSPAYPGAYAAPIPPAVLAFLKYYLQLSQSMTRLHTDCAGADYALLPPATFDARTTADPTWMYITADVVWTCTCLLPSVDAATYWQDGPTSNPGYSPYGAQRMTDNVLMGQLRYLNSTTRRSESVLAVHLEADPALGADPLASPVRNTGTGELQTFYHQYSAPAGVSDLREPLPTAWSTGYLDVDPILSTTLRVFKAPTASPDLDLSASVSSSGCGSTPWTTTTVSGLGADMKARDCLAYTYYAWDDDANVIVTSAAVDPLRPNLMPLATQELPISELNLPDQTGWVQLMWPPTNTDQADNYQVWVSNSLASVNNYSMARQGLVIANGNCIDPIFASGLEIGTTAPWSSSVP